MADTLDITEGTGTTIATQDEGGVHYQEVKLVASGTGTTEALSKAEDSGHASGNHGIMALTVRQDTAAALSGTDADYQPLVTDASGRLHVLDQNSGAILTALQIIDDWDDSDKCNVNINVAGTDVAANAGVLNAQTLRVTIATDDECNNYLGTIDADTGAIKTAVEALDDAIDGSYLNCNLNIAGTDCVGNSGVLAAGVLRVTIATDDEVNNLLGTIDTDTGNIVTAVQLIDDAIYIDDADWSDGASKHMLVGGLYQSAPQSITDGDVGPLQVDADGALHISDGGNTITVDGTVTANLSSTDNTVLDNIQAAVEIMDDWDDANYCNVNINIAGTDCDGGSGAQGAQTLRVILATDDPAVALLTTIDSDTNDIKTAVEVIDDWDSVHASAAATDGPQIMGAAYSAGLPTNVGADADAARICTDRFGRVLAGIMPQNFQATITSADAQSATAVKAKTANRKMYILSLIASTDTALNLQFQDDTGPTVLIEGIYLAANGGFVMNWPPEAPLVVNTNEDFDVIASAAGNISVTITGYLAV